MFFSGRRLQAARVYMFKTIDSLVLALEEQHNLKINKGMVSRWENGKSIPREENIKALASVLKVPTDYLTGKATFNHLLRYLRFINNLTIEELSKKSGVSVHSISLAEEGISLLREWEFKEIENALEIQNLRSYATHFEGINIEAYTVEEAEYMKDAKEASDIEFYEQHEKPLLLKDINYLLENENDITFKNRLLTNEDRKKINKIIEVLLASEDDKEN